MSVRGMNAFRLLVKHDEVAQQQRVEGGPGRPDGARRGVDDGVDVGAAVVDISRAAPCR